MASTGERATGRTYSRNHCFTKMPMKAEASAETRLENHKVLITTAHAGARNSGGGAIVTAWVELIKPFDIEKLSSFDEISARI